MHKPQSEWKKEIGAWQYVFNAMPYAGVISLTALLILAGFGILSLMK